jgi:hypothetical protein
MRINALAGISSCIVIDPHTHTHSHSGHIRQLVRGMPYRYYYNHTVEKFAHSFDGRPTD